ncbi:roadblock/LC7 domain-containing protein [Prauserella oleivorans]|uniref:Roadblock/LC7 domain-containing protein n=1 Tax=Prauserella oleivorans TaxID=1478153 RepID=A0ABW5W340_9PSEU
MNHDVLITELRTLREQVSGVTDALIAAVDGLTVVADVADTLDPDNVSALAATGLGLARRTTSVIGHGTLRQFVVQSSGGILATYAIGDVALLVVLGDEGLDMARLHQQVLPTLERLGSLLNAPQVVAS